MNDKVILIDIDPAHMSDREKALRALYQDNISARTADLIIEVGPNPPKPEPELVVKSRKVRVKSKFERIERPKPFRKEKSESLKRLLRK